MRVEYINPFVEAAFNVLREVLQSDVKRGELYLKSTSMPVMGVAAIVGLAGDVEGRVLDTRAPRWYKRPCFECPARLAAGAFRTGG